MKPIECNDSDNVNEDNHDVSFPVAERLAWVFYQIETGDLSRYVPGEWPSSDEKSHYMDCANKFLALASAETKVGHAEDDESTAGLKAELSALHYKVPGWNICNECSKGNFSGLDALWPCKTGAILAKYTVND